MKSGLKEPRLAKLSEAEEAMVVAFGRHTLLPLDNCLYALKPTIPHLTRSALHRCLQRHGLSRLPDVGGDKPRRQRLKRYPVGFFHIEITEVQWRALEKWPSVKWAFEPLEEMRMGQKKPQA